MKVHIFPKPISMDRKLKIDTPKVSIFSNGAQFDYPDRPVLVLGSKISNRQVFRLEDIETFWISDDPCDKEKNGG